MAGDSRRTKTEKQANDFDLKLYNLVCEADRLADQPHLGNKWRGIAESLRVIIRPAVRAMMNPYDRKETE